MSQKEKELKQFSLNNREDCIIYLLRIISSMDLCLSRLKEYNKQFEGLIKKYRGEKTEKIPYTVYTDLLDKTSGIETYLLNLIGDAQTESVSYFKYRKLAEKLIKKGVQGVAITGLNDEIKEYLSDFNRLRNWYNHIPESLLTSELNLITSDNISNFLANPSPIRVYYYSYVSFDFFNHMYLSNKDFYTIARMLHQTIKKDYSVLINESVEIERIYTEKIKNIDHLAATKMSAKIQGLKVDNDEQGS